MTDAPEPPESADDTPLARVEPTPPDSRPDPGPYSIARSLAFGIIGFVATLILLFGLASFVRPSAGGTAVGSGSPSAADATSPGASASVSPSDGLTSASPSAAQPSDAPSGDPVLVGAGDIADCGLDSDSATAALLDTIDGTVFTAGDNAYPDGSPSQFRDCYGPTWGRHLARTRPAAGNHDWGTKDLAGYRRYFGAAAAPNGTSWYSYDLGTWHIVVLDSNCPTPHGCGPTSDQGRWLTADLGASTARCTMAIWHHPRFSSGEHGNHTTVAPFWQALYEAGADVIVNGHDHDYERFAPQDPDGRSDVARGLRQFVVGTGGAALRGFPSKAANSIVRASVAHGVIRLVLRPSRFEFRFITTTGAFSDSGSAACH